jgi:SanA protein
MSFFFRRSAARFVLIAIISLFLSLVLVFLGDQFVERAAQGKLSDDLANVPERPVALVLGCAPTLANGRPNRYFTARMKTAADLFHTGKCRYLLVSGDNGRSVYDEPTSMRDALVALGVPESAIVRDYAGFDTLDSVLRAKEVFSQETLLVVSQRFHNERAICIGQHHGMDLYGVNAVDVSGPLGVKVRFREKLARVKTLLDLHLWKSRPKFLGPLLSIGNEAG